LKGYRIAYELTLSDSFLAKLLEKYYSVHMQLVRSWGTFYFLYLIIFRGFQYTRSTLWK